MCIVCMITNPVRLVSDRDPTTPSATSTYETQSKFRRDICPNVSLLLDPKRPTFWDQEEQLDVEKLPLPEVGFNADKWR